MNETTAYRSRRGGLLLVLQATVLVPLTMGLACPGSSPIPGPGCDSDADCDDGRFCNGVETCGDDGGCIDGPAPCSAEDCIENADYCPECTTDADCVNPGFCEGLLMRCELGECESVPGGDPPCENFCDEANDACTDTEPCDAETTEDIAGLWVGTYFCTSSCGDSFGGAIALTITQSGLAVTHTDSLGGAFEGTLCGSVYTLSDTQEGITETGVFTLTEADSATKQSHYRSETAPFCEGDCSNVLSRQHTGNDDGGDAPPPPTGGCANFGEACETDDDCCNDFPCVDGECI